MKTVRIINPGGRVIDAPEDSNGVRKAREGKDGWKMPDTAEDGGEESPPRRRRGRPPRRRVEE